MPKPSEFPNGNRTLTKNKLIIIFNYLGARACFPLKPAALKNKFRNVSRGLPSVAPLPCYIMFFNATGNRCNHWRSGSG